MDGKAILCFIAFFLVAAPVAYADAPRIISVQGRLTDSFGEEIINPTDFRFRIYDAEVAGNLLWTEVWSGASAVNPDPFGVFSVMLGSSFPLNLGFDEPYWLEVEVEGDILAPRHEIGSAGYALSVADDSITNAKIANNAVTGSKIANGAVTNSKIANNAVTGSKIADGSITGADINDGSVSSSDVNFVGTITADKWCVANAAGTALNCDTNAPAAGADADWTISGTDMYSAVTGDVGIGTIVPQAKLHVVGPSPAAEPTALFEGDYITIEDSSPQIKLVDANDFRYWQIHNSGGDFNFESTGNSGATWTKKVTFDETGNVGIRTSPNVALDVNGSIEYTGTLTDVSDERLKENIIGIDDPISKIQGINGVYFNMIDSDKREAGVIAQNLQNVLPEAVSVVDVENGYLGVDYTSIVPVLIEAVKEQQNQIESLQEEIALLKANSC